MSEKSEILFGGTGKFELLASKHWELARWILDLEEKGIFEFRRRFWNTGNY